MGPTDARAAGVTVRTFKRGVVRCQVDGKAVKLRLSGGRAGFGDCLVETGITGVDATGCSSVACGARHSRNHHAGRLCLLGGSELSGGAWRNTCLVDIVTCSMLHRGGTFRLLVSVLLIVAVPFCCCNFHAVMQSCAGCTDSTVTGGSSENSGTRAAGHEHSSCGTHEEGSNFRVKTGCESSLTVKKLGEPVRPGLPGLPEKGEHDSCACGSHVSKLPASAKVSFELPALIMAVIVDWPWMPGVTALDQPVVVGDDERGVARPRTSLLRLHCALMV